MNALEPLGYTASGSFQILRYTTDLFNLYRGIAKDPTENVLPDNFGATSKLDDSTGQFANGNSLLDRSSFNPLELLISYSFDIEVYERFNGDNSGKLLFRFIDCRMDGYSFDFTPGSLLTENVSFVCRVIQDSQACSVTSVEDYSASLTSTVTLP